MLFDPALTDEKQRKKLAELESKLDSTQQQLAEAKAYADKAAKERVIVTREVPAPVEALSSASNNVLTSPARSGVSTNIYAQNPVLTAQRPVSQKLRPDLPAVSRQNLSARAIPQPMISQVSQRDVAMAQEAKAQAQALAKTQAETQAQLQALRRAQANTKKPTQAQLQQLAQAQKMAQEQAQALAKAETIARESQARVLEAQTREVQARDQLQAVAREKMKIEPAAIPVAKAMPRYQLSQNNIQSLLSRSGVPLNGAVVRVADDQYRWDAANIIGKAYIGKASEVGGIQNFAQNTIAKAKQACGGDFAAVPASSNRFEMACIGGVYSSSASLVLYQKGQEIIAITHETSADDMDIAMDIGDKIAKNLSAL